MTQIPFEPSRNVKTSEETLLALLLRMVLENCASTGDTLDSWGYSTNSAAMRILAEAGFIRIDEDADGRVRGKELPEAEAFLSRMAATSPS
ncbi:MAG: hypothetical protein ACLP7P_02235 [Rhodomicrobium sp.]